MVNVETTPDLSAQDSRSNLPALFNSMKDKRHWLNITTVTDSVYSVLPSLSDQSFDISATTLASGLSLPASDATTAGMAIYYFVSDATNAVTVARNGADLIAGVAADLVLHAGWFGMLVSTGAGSWLHMTSASSWKQVAVRSANYVASILDDVALCDTTGGTITVTLPTAASALGKILTFKKIDASVNKITVDGSAAETIDGAATVSVTGQWSHTSVISDGTNWVTI